jgi:hypothetical protein
MTSIGPWRHLHTDGSDTDVYTTDVTTTFSLRALGGIPLGNVRAALEAALQHVEFEVQSDPQDDPNGYTTVQVHTS